MVDYSHLELFHGLGRGGHRHDDTPVTVEVMGVNVLQLLHKFRQHGGHRGTPLVSSLSGRLSEEVDQTLAPLGTKASEDSMKKAGDRPPDLSDGEDADSLLVQVNRRLRQHLNIDNPSVFDIPPSLMEL